jgi:hypothetical protein
MARFPRSVSFPYAWESEGEGETMVVLLLLLLLLFLLYQSCIRMRISIVRMKDNHDNTNDDITHDLDELF